MEKECAKISMKILGDKTLKQKLVTQVERVTDNFKRFTNRFLEHFKSYRRYYLSYHYMYDIYFSQYRTQLCAD